MNVCVDTAVGMGTYPCKCTATQVVIAGVTLARLKYSNGNVSRAFNFCSLICKVASGQGLLNPVLTATDMKMGLIGSVKCSIHIESLNIS